MKEATFQQEIYVAAAVEDTFNYLADRANQLKLHPLIIAVEELERGRDANNHSFAIWQITDRVPMFGLSMKVKYQTKVTLSTAPTILHEANQAMGIKVRNLITFTPQGAGTLVQEHVTISAPGLLLGFTVKQAQEAHTGMLKNLKTQLEKNASPPIG